MGDKLEALSSLGDQNNNKEKMETIVPMPVDPDEMNIETMDSDNMLGREPAEFKCGNCLNAVTSSVESSFRNDGWMFSCCCCLFGCWLNALLVMMILSSVDCIAKSHVNMKFS